jgi:hypothetical protein
MTGVEKRMVVEYGTDLDDVWLPFAMMRRLDKHGPWTVPFTEATADQARVLVAHALAERHNSGLRRGVGLRNFLDAPPFELTVPFGKVPAGRPPAGQGAVPEPPATGTPVRPARAGAPESARNPSLEASHDRA